MRRPGPGPRTEEHAVSDAEPADAYLVRAAQDGYIDAFEELVTRHGARVYRTALRLLGNHADAEDLAQETFLAAWRSLEQFRGQSLLSTWLYRIVTRLALNRLQRSRTAASLDLIGEVSDSSAGPAEAVERHLTVDAVTDAVTQLPPAQRIVVVLHHFEGLPYPEVAAITKSSVPAVRSHLFRARRTLARTLQEWR